MNYCIHVRLVCFQVVSGDTCTLIATNKGLSSASALEALNYVGACSALQVGNVSHESIK